MLCSTKVKKVFIVIVVVVVVVVVFCFAVVVVVVAFLLCGMMDSSNKEQERFDCGMFGTEPKPGQRPIRAVVCARQLYKSYQKK